MVEQKRNVMAHAQKSDLVFRRNGRVLLYRRGCQLSRVLACVEFGSEENDCIIFSKYVDHRLKMSLQDRKKLVKRSGEREIVYNVYKFMKSESEVGITIPLSKVQKRVVEATRISRRTLCRVLKEGENVETGVTMSQCVLSCKANTRVKLAKTGHGPHSQLVVICVLLLFVFSVLFVSFYVLLCVNTIAVDKYIVSFIIIWETTELTVSTLVKCYTETVMLKLSNFTT